MRNNKQAALLLCILLILSFSVPAFAEDGASGTGAGSGSPIVLSSAADLQQLRENPGASFVLSQDIDMSGVDWVPAAFYGELDGGGHTIYNLKVTRFGEARADTLDGNAKVYDSVFAGLFSTLTDATVKDLCLRGVDIDVSGSDHCFAAALAGYIRNSEVRDCVIRDARVSITPTCKPEPDKDRRSCNSGVGGIAGFGNGTFINCDVDCVLVFDDQCDPGLKVEQFMGGVLSAGNAEIQGCTIDIDGYAAMRGYAHNGGLVGMFYQYDKSFELGSITDTKVSGSITFYENNRDRRAYCEPYIGEKMTWPKISGCTQSFKNNETFDYSRLPLPEKCEEPKVEDTVRTGSCEELGYTEHKCSVCGNSWRDTFTPKVHVPGEWTVVSMPEGGKDGLKQLTCTRCGMVIDEHVIKAVRYISAISPAPLDLKYREEAQCTAEVMPEDAEGYTLVWSSSDEKVASVDQNGRVRAVGRGAAVITCATQDGYACSTFTVKVDYSFWQWLIKIVLFGWIWY